MSVSVDKIKNLVDGELVEGIQKEWQEIFNPATGEASARVPRDSEEDVDRAVKAADRAFAVWSETTPGERARLLHKLADAVEEDAEELACYWGIMLVMIALGHGLLWMLLLGGAMFSERRPSQGVVFARTAGVLLVLCGSIAAFGVS